MCSCGRTRVQNPKTSYGNLINHTKSDHNDWEEIMKAKDSKNPSMFVNKRKGTKVFKWLEWIVMSNWPFTLVEDP